MHLDNDGPHLAFPAFHISRASDAPGVGLELKFLCASSFQSASSSRFVPFFWDLTQGLLYLSLRSLSLSRIFATGGGFGGVGGAGQTRCFVVPELSVLCCLSCSRSADARPHGSEPLFISFRVMRSGLCSDNR